MQVYSNYQYHPQFRNNATLANLTNKIPNTSVCRNMTYLDRNALVAYLHASKYRLHNCAEELKSLFKLDGDDFVNSSYVFLCEQLNIPEAVRPQIEILPTQQENPMGYLPAFNTIVRNADLSNYTKPQIFGFIRHELQHLLQNLDIFRHEKLGPTAAEIYAQNRANSTRIAIDYYVENITPEIFYELTGESKEATESFRVLQKYYKEGNKEAYEREYLGFEEPIKQEVQAFLDLVVKEMGTIKEGTKEANNAEIFFDEFCSVNYYDPNGQIDLGRYYTTAIESDACLAGDINRFNMETGGCFFKKLKDDGLAVLNNKESEEYKSIEKATKNSRSEK